MTDRHSTPSTTDQPVLSRRRLLATGASAGAVALAGCSAIVDFLADFVLKDVNVFNGTDKRIRGSMTVKGPDGMVLLDERFSLAPGNDGSSNTTDNNTTSNQSIDTSSSEGPVPLQSNNTTAGNNTSNNDTVSNDRDQSLATYGDVLTSAGDYTVTLELGPDSTVRGRQSANQTTTVDNPGNEHIMVFVGSDENSKQATGPFLITAVSGFSELENLNQSDVSSNSS